MQSWQMHSVFALFREPKRQKCKSHGREKTKDIKKSTKKQMENQCKNLPNKFTFSFGEKQFFKKETQREA